MTNYDKITSVIIDKGIDYRYGTKGNKSKSFYIQLNDTDRKLGIYRMTKNYGDLLDNFIIGDTVTVYYRDNNNPSENINIDLVQVVKGKKILLDKKEYERKESSLIYIGLIAGVLTIVLSFFYYKRKILPNAT